MVSRFTELAIDCADPRRLAQFWCSVLDYEVQEEDDGTVTIGSPAAPGRRPGRRRGRSGPGQAEHLTGQPAHAARPEHEPVHHLDHFAAAGQRALLIQPALARSEASGFANVLASDGGGAAEPRGVWQGAG